MKIISVLERERERARARARARAREREREREKNLSPRAFHNYFAVNGQKPLLL